MPKQLGLIGLGKMGFPVAENLLEKGFEVVATDVNSEAVEKIAEKGAAGTSSINELSENLPETPKVIIVLVPAEVVGNVLDELSLTLSEGDIILECGNSFYRDSQERAKKLAGKGIVFMDVGMSGGVSGARHGACLMIGGEKAAFEKAKPVFEALSKNGSCQYLGKSGSGHLAKGYHNLAEYGCLQSLAESLSTLNSISDKEGLNIELLKVCEIWNKGSIIESRISRDAETALKNNPSLEGISGSVTGQTRKEMEKLVKIANDYGVEVPSCEAAVRARADSRKAPTFAGKLTNAIRNVFGGHAEWKKR